MGSGGPGSGEDGSTMEYDGVKGSERLGCEWLGALEGVAKGPITCSIAAWERHSRRALEGAMHDLEQATASAPRNLLALQHQVATAVPVRQLPASGMCSAPARELESAFADRCRVVGRRLE